MSIVYTTEEGEHFAECLPITIFRDIGNGKEAILAVVGSGEPASGATDEDRAMASDIVDALNAHDRLTRQTFVLADPLRDAAPAMRDALAAMEALPVNKSWDAAEVKARDMARAALALAGGEAK